MDDLKKASVGLVDDLVGLLTQPIRDKLAAMEARALAAEAEVERLRAELTPFAKPSGLTHQPGDADMVVRFLDHDQRLILKLSDFRLAQEAMEPVKS